MVSLCLRQIAFTVLILITASAFAETAPQSNAQAVTQPAVTNAPVVLPKPAPVPIAVPNSGPIGVPADGEVVGQPQIFANQDLQLRVTETTTNQTLQIRGVLFPRDAAVVNQAVAALKTNKPLTMIMANFGGGTYGPILDLETQLSHICPRKSGCPIKTIVNKNQICASNCITFYMMGGVREASEGAICGFHEASNGPNPAPGSVERAYALAGISPDWIKDHAKLFASTTITRLKPDDMMGSGIVTKIVRDVTHSNER